MKGLLLILGAALILICSCSHKPSENELFAAQKGREAAEKAISLKPGSMTQEHAILAIRATEEKIKQTGDTSAARAYIKAAEHLLDSAGIIADHGRRDISDQALGLVEIAQED